MTEEELLVDCLRRLEGSGIDYMLVGSMAGNYWGVPRSTHDIDFVIEYEADQVAKIVGAFQDYFFIQEISVESGLRTPHQFNALDNRSALKVDFFRVAGDEYEFERFGRRKRVTLFDQSARFAPLVPISDFLRKCFVISMCGNLRVNWRNDVNQKVRVNRCFARRCFVSIGVPFQTAWFSIGLPIETLNKIRVQLRSVL